MRMKFIVPMVLCSLIISQGTIINGNPKDLSNINHINITNSNILEKFREVYILPKEINILINETNKKPNYEIALSEKYQNLVYELCVKNNLSYDMVLSIMYQESRFNQRAINHNTNHSIDMGLFQLNNRFIPTHHERAVKYCYLPKNTFFDVWNPDHNIRAGIGNIVYLQDYWKTQGIMDEQSLERHVENSLQLGLYGYEKTIKQTGRTSREYDRLISRNKNLLIKNHTLL